jgi:argininosuccinate synthase
MSKKIILAYSGGLDTSVAINILRKEYDYEVYCMTADLGNLPDNKDIIKRGLEAGAEEVQMVDAKKEFLESYVFPALKANALYQEKYPLATALARPLIAKMLIEKANEVGANSVAHGCTGKGNDQVRFDVSLQTLKPDIEIIATGRENNMTREAVIKYAEKNKIPLPPIKSSPYSTDENIWGRSIECGILEDPWEAPPEEIYEWTKPINKTPNEAAEVQIEFLHGKPMKLNNDITGSIEIVDLLNQLAGDHGIGRIDMVEDRVVGIKSREIYESPAAIVLLTAHKALESITLTRQQRDFKKFIDDEYAKIIYDGLWFSRHHADLSSYINASQKYVNGTVRMKLWHGNAIVDGMQSSSSLYDPKLATYSEDDEFDQSIAKGFISIWGLPLKTQAKNQGHLKEDSINEII